VQESAGGVHLHAREHPLPPGGGGKEEGKGLDETGSKATASKEAVGKFCASLALLGDVYVMDAFATAHRAHSSMLGEGFAERCMGRLVEAELKAFASLLDEPATPVLGICGGYKLDKIAEIKPLIQNIHSLILCGGISSTFLKAKCGTEIGGEDYKAERAPIALEILDEAERSGVDVSMPLDWAVSSISPSHPSYGQEGTLKMVTREEGVPAEKAMVDLGGDALVERPWKPFDIGPATRESFAATIAKAKTVFWNGPPGMYKFPKAADGSKAMAEAVAAAAERGAQVVLGGGGTSALYELYCPSAAEKSHVCSGGGVSLELMAKKSLPALVALSSKGSSVVC